MATNKAPSKRSRHLLVRPLGETAGVLAGERLFGSRLYDWSLGTGNDERPVYTPPDPWPGDAARGARLLREPVAFHDQPSQRGANRGLVLDHEFSWLRDLRSVGGERARQQARRLVADWIGRNDRWSPVIWQQAVLSQRIVSWLANYEFFCASADDVYRSSVSGSMARQLRHLRRVIRIGPRDGDRIIGLGTLAIATLCGLGRDRTARAFLQRIGRELSYQIRQDGGHIERSPSRQFAVLRHLIELRAALAGAGSEVPEWLAERIETLGASLPALRHGDGGFAVFNSGQPGRATVVDMILSRAAPRGKSAECHGAAGFDRLDAGDTRVFVDVTAPPPPGSDRCAGAGTLAFEMSAGAERIVVNCGALGEAGRATAAHSTAVVDDTNSAEILAGLGLGARPTEVSVRRATEDGSTLIEASHDGYVRRYGVRHCRRLYLASDGGDLRGEDSIEGENGVARGKRFTIRFHLHPDIRTQRIPERGIVTLLLPSGARWRFRATGGEVTLAESIYSGDIGDPRPSEQILVAGLLNGRNALVKWSLRRQDDVSA